MKPQQQHQQHPQQHQHQQQPPQQHQHHNNNNNQVHHVPPPHHLSHHSHHHHHHHHQSPQQQHGHHNTHAHGPIAHSIQFQHSHNFEAQQQPHHLLRATAAAAPPPPPPPQSQQQQQQQPPPPPPPPPSAQQQHHQQHQLHQQHQHPHQPHHNSQPPPPQPHHPSHHQHQQHAHHTAHQQLMQPIPFHQLNFEPQQMFHMATPQPLQHHHSSHPAHHHAQPHAHPATHHTLVHHPIQFPPSPAAFEAQQQQHLLHVAATAPPTQPPPPPTQQQQQQHHQHPHQPHNSQPPAPHHSSHHPHHQQHSHHHAYHPLAHPMQYQTHVFESPQPAQALLREGLPPPPAQQYHHHPVAPNAATPNVVPLVPPVMPYLPHIVRPPMPPSQTTTYARKPRKRLAIIDPQTGKDVLDDKSTPEPKQESAKPVPVNDERLDSVSEPLKKLDLNQEPVIDNKIELNEEPKPEPEQAESQLRQPEPELKTQHHEGPSKPGTPKPEPPKPEPPKLELPSIPEVKPETVQELKHGIAPQEVRPEEKPKEEPETSKQDKLANEQKSPPPGLEQQLDKPVLETEQQSDKRDLSPEIKAQPTLPDLPYSDGQWTPLNHHGRKKYTKEFLLAIAKLLRVRLIQQSPDFMPNFIQQKEYDRYAGIAGGGGVPAGDRFRRPSQQVNINNKQPRKVIATHSLQQEVELNKTENPWKPVTIDQKAAETDEEKLTSEKLLKAFRGHLNKLTPQKYEKIIEQIQALDLGSNERMNKVIDLVFDKAVDEPKFCELYAKTCKVLADKEVNQTKFRYLLVKKCQEEFETSDIYQGIDVDGREEEIEREQDAVKKKQMSDDLYEDMRRRRSKYLGTIKLIGEMYKLDLLLPKIIGLCINFLMQTLTNENCECLCGLIATVGKKMSKDENVVVRKVLQNTLHQLHQITKDKEKAETLQLESRIRFKILDIVDLSRRDWKSRQDENNPKTLEAIQREVEQKEWSRRNHLPPRAQPLSK